MMRLLRIDKTRTSYFHLQSNSVIERMNRTLLNVLTKSSDQEKALWSHFLPIVLMAYRSSVHESTGFTPNFVVFGHELLLPLDLMYPPSVTNKPADVNKHVIQKQAVFHRAFQLDRRNTTNQQRLRKALYNKKYRGPTCHEGGYILLHYAVTATGQSSKLVSPRRGPHRILYYINAVKYKTEEVSIRKQLIVHNDQWTLITDNLLVRLAYPNRTSTCQKQSPHTGPSDAHEPRPLCCNVLAAPVSLSAPPTCPTPSPTDHSPPWSPADSMTSHVLPSTPPRSSADSFNASAIPADSAFPYNRFSHEPTPVVNFDEQLQFREFTSSCRSSFVPSPVDTIIQKAARHLQQADQALPHPLSRTYFPRTTHQRKAEPLYKALLPRNLIDALSPRKPG